MKRGCENMDKEPEIKHDFDGTLMIHGGHFSLKESEEIATYWGYLNDDEKITRLDYKWATWGRLPGDIAEDGITHGWWIVDPNRGYKHIKKVTYLTIGEK
jgi:hypothetical protein